MKAKLLCILIVSLTLFGCDSSLKVKSNAEAPPTIEALHKESIYRGINPAYVDFDQMYESGDFESFVAKPIALNREQMRQISERWPTLFGEDRIKTIDRQMAALSTVGPKNTSIYTGDPSDQDVCWGIGAYPSDPDPGSEFCECVRDPFSCTTSAPEDEPSGGGGGTTSEENINQCSGIEGATAQDIGMVYGSHINAYQTSSSVDYQSESWTGAELLGWDTICYGLEVGVKATLYRLTADGTQYILSSKDKSPDFLFASDFEAINFQGSASLYGTRLLKQEASHYAGAYYGPATLLSLEKRSFDEFYVQ